MSLLFLTTREAVGELGISTATLDDWLTQSDAGTLLIRGQPVSIDYFQGGPRGQGRIRIPASEIQRLNDLMRVRPQPRRPPRTSLRTSSFPGITVPLGRPALR
jgi:hypothetical protein